MGSKHQPVRDRGIYHSLPQFDPAIRDLTAVVTGANGISGFHTMRALLQSPERWKRIYALSRNPPPQSMMDLLSADERSRVHHVAIDFLEDAETIAQKMADAKVVADYIFFYSYLQPRPPSGVAILSNLQDLVDVNAKLLDNFLKALVQLGVTPKRFLLQTGAKNYGVQFGRWRVPAMESDPQPVHLGPNFYYPQEKLLFDYCKSQGTTWSVIRPAWIIGAVNNAQMNALYPFAVYAAVQAKKGEPLDFPADWDAWQYEPRYSTAMLTAYLSEWAILEDVCKNEAFNSVDTESLVWDRFYHALVTWYGVDQGVKAPEEDLAKYQQHVGKSGKDTAMGYGPPIITNSRFSLVSWASEQANIEAWRSIMESSGQVTHNPFEDPEAHFGCGDAAFIRAGTLSMTKARKLGWTGFVDTSESVFEMYKEMASLKMLPVLKAKSASD